MPKVDGIPVTAIDAIHNYHAKATIRQALSPERVIRKMARELVEVVRSTDQLDYVSVFVSCADDEPSLCIVGTKGDECVIDVIAIGEKEVCGA